ncbi:MAG: DUF484 family protein [Rhodospirillales bacterium]
MTDRSTPLATAARVAPLDDGAVADYLRANPDFLQRHPDLLRDLTPPERWSGDGVVDLQSYMVSALRSENSTLKACAEEVIETQRGNMSVQTRVHQAVLALLAEQDEAGFLRVALREWPLMLDVDVISIGFERMAGATPFCWPDGQPAGSDAEPDADLRALPAGYGRMLMEGNGTARLFGLYEDDGTLFGAASTLVRSTAVARIGGADGLPLGLIALGSRQIGAFDQAQGSELLCFLAAVVHRWLAAFSRHHG